MKHFCTIGAAEIRDAIRNIGVIEYQRSKGKEAAPPRGILFDYTEKGDYLARKTIELSPASVLISRQAPQIFDDFFYNPKQLDGHDKIIDLIKEAEEHFLRDRK